MKKTVNNLTILLLLLFLVGCQANPPPFVESGSNDIFDLPQVKMISSVDGILGKTTASTSNGYYQLDANLDGSSIITYIDYATFQKVVLCNRIDCSHSDESCPAWFSKEDNTGGLGLIANEKALYAVKLGNNLDLESSDRKSKIWKMNSDGSDRKLLYGFSADESIWGAIFSNSSTGKLYFLLDHIDETTKDVKIVRELVELDEKTQHISAISEVKETSFLLGVCNSGFVFKELQIDETAPINSDLVKHVVTLYDPNTQKNRELLQWTGSTDAFVRVFDNAIYFLDFKNKTLEKLAVENNDLTKTVVSTEIPYQEGDNIYCREIVDGNLLFKITSTSNTGKKKTTSQKYYSVTLDSGTITENLLMFDSYDTQFPVEILAETENQLLVISSRIPATVKILGPDGSTYEKEIERDCYSLIENTDFWNNIPNYHTIADNT